MTAATKSPVTWKGVPDSWPLMAEDSSPDDPRNTPFSAILVYVLGFILVLGLLAWIGACLLHNVSR